MGDQNTAIEANYKGVQLCIYYFFYCLLEGCLLAILLVALILHLFSSSSPIRGRLTNDDEWYFWVSLFALGLVLQVTRSRTRGSNL